VLDVAEKESRQCLEPPISHQFLLRIRIVRQTTRWHKIASCRPRSTISEGDCPHAPRRRVQDYITAHLGQTITNDALAEVAGLSVCHFARVFKQTEGYVAAPLRAALSSEASKGAFGRQQNVTVADCFCCGLFRSEPLHPLVSANLRPYPRRLQVDDAINVTARWFGKISQTGSTQVKARTTGSSIVTPPVGAPLKLALHPAV
jgi:hypothetical protein